MGLGQVYRDSLQLSTDLLYMANDKAISQDFFYTTAKELKATLAVKAHYISPRGDSTLILRSVSDEIMLPADKHILQYHYGKQSKELYTAPGFAACLRYADQLPAGRYVYTVSLYQGNDTLTHTYFLKQVDSAISAESALRRDIMEIVQTSVKANGGNGDLKALQQKASNKVSNALNLSHNKIDRYLRKKQLTAQYLRSGDDELLHLYSDTLLVGTISLPAAQSFSNLYVQEKEQLNNRIADFSKDQLENMRSLQNQFREILEGEKKDRSITGDINVSGNWANQQEPNSMQDNQYYEVGGQLSFPIADIPITLTGYYTTQDQHREAKASYFRFSYDAQKAKEQLMKLVGSYNKKYEQTFNKGFSYDMVYSQFVNGLQSEKNNLLNRLKKEAGVENFDPSVYNEAYFKARAEEQVARLKAKAIDSAQQLAAGNDTLAAAKAKAQALQAKATAQYAKAMEYYNKIQALEEKIRRYEKLVQQYKQNLHYDSLLAYDQLKDLKDLDQMSYKDMAKKAAGLLPEGKAKTFIAGLTSFDAGIFPKYVSRFTQSGQMMKGLDAGYDIGFAEIGGGYGNTEFVDRTGTVETYKAYNLRMTSKPVKQQQLGFVYYGYSPSKRWLKNDDFFKGADLSLPSFRNPISIVAATYNGSFGKDIHVEGEYAFSNQQRSSSQYTDQGNAAIAWKERSAYSLKADGSLLNNNVLLRGEYEYAGKNFENNTLPMMLSGIERLQVGAEGNLFRSFLRMNVEYNYMIQQNFTNTGKNAKWGFALSTHSKRYPSVSISYKPFTTFRTFTDTLNVPQKPVLGEVWTAKANYQIKKKNYALRFTLVYNKNTSIMDTLNYSSSMLQFNTLYSTATQSLMLTLGRSGIQSTSIAVPYPAFNNSSYLMLSGTQQFSKGTGVGLSTDIAVNETGLAKYGWGCNGFYRLPKQPLTIRLNFRNSNYKMAETTAWEHLYGGSLELLWQINTKL
ncbi:hypothetical protein [Edaphocola aurantiacus]|uniref:hypothetical protein n=1 Tax=Edaphocola aurantiacus TaxID=2601682 RepID=UPI001C95D7ED|nr:hypothetical protein [Edaphocola aurantiacus]